MLLFGGGGGGGGWQVRRVHPRQTIDGVSCWEANDCMLGVGVGVGYE